MSADSNTTLASIVVPGSVQAGDQLVYVVTVNSVTTATTPAGWTLLGTREDGRDEANPDMTSWVFTRTADAGLAGSTVSSTLGAQRKASRSLVAFAGASAPTQAVSSVMGASSADLSTPGVVIDGEVVHSAGVPSRSKVEGWF